MISAFGVDHGSISKADKHHVALEAGAAATGAGLGQGVYQAAGYGPKHINLKRNYYQPEGQRHKIPKGWTKNQYNEALKTAKKQYGAYTPKMMRHMPKEVPGARTFRALGYTHHGKLGMALGAAATVGGATAVYSAARHKEKA